MPPPTSQNCSAIVADSSQRVAEDALFDAAFWCVEAQQSMRPFTTVRGARRAGAIIGAVVAAAVLAVPAGGSARTFGHFRSVLAQGEGQTITPGDLGPYEATKQPPPSFVDQQPLYVGIMPHAHDLTAASLDAFYKPTDFGSLPGGPGSVTHPPGHPEVSITRDGRFQMAHITAPTRDGLMLGAGYATAQERLFLMDALRRTAKGTLAELTGPSQASGDASQLTDQDFSDAELNAQVDALPRHFGAEGEQARQDLIHYIAGINARINQVNIDPTQRPAEYAALGVTSVAPWSVSDSAALAVLLVTQFTVSNGDEQVNALMEQAFRRHFGRRWRAPYTDFREAQDPEAFTVAKRTFPSDNPGRVRAGLNAMPDYGSLHPRNAIVSGPGAASQSSAAAAMPSWVRSIEGLRRALPPVESNAVLVARRRSLDGRALGAMGPQVGYYSPQIFSEYELHGGGIDSEGVTFPGASPYPLIGHGIDFAWSGTSANGDNEDTFVERLCNPDGSRASTRSTHYVYHGRCIPFLMRDQTVHTPYSPLDPTTPPQTITYRTMRSVHGPVFYFATVHGHAVALTKAKAVDFHEIDAIIPFKRLAENRATSARSFMRIMGEFPGTENWFYVDHRDIAFQQSGRYPRHARGSDVDLPFWGDGRADWQRFDAHAYTFASIPASHRPQALNPRDGFIISWNNKEAPGWRKGPSEWSNGPVHHALILQRKLEDQFRARHGKADLVRLTRSVNLAATTDLRGEVDYAYIRRVIGRVRGGDRRLLRILDAWVRSGSQRLDANGDNVYDHSAAVALMDAWWPRMVRAEFQPVVGKRLFDIIEDRVLGLGGFGWSWASQVQKDLRNVLGAREPAHGRRLAHARRHCRSLLLTTLRSAAAAVRQKLGPDPAGWKVYATCKNPDDCDEIVPNTAGAVDTPPFPWQNRGTYHQVVEVNGHR
jgi:acyl-homoserine lactone acylase PvdQ